MDHLASPPNTASPREPTARRPRTFLCRDALWEGLEQVASELECTVDYLVNDAIKHYMRQRLTRRTDPEPRTKPIAEASLPLTPSGQFRVPLPPPPRLAPPPAPPSMRAAPPLPSREPPARALPPLPMPPRPLPPPPPLRSTLPTPPWVAPALAPEPSRVPPAARGWAPEPPGAPSARARLTVTHANTTRPVTGTRFVIGRSKVAGLAIKDPNISRQHAVIEEHEGRFFLVDLGSTNGTWVSGERVARRAIADGDVALICDHAILFTLTP
jgi:hypothetical protein